jgi:hypothetical protein
VKRTPAAPAALTATAATALLLLTACGGGGGGHPHDKITGASSGTSSPSAAPSPSASEAKGPERPSTALPADLKLVFDWPATGNATKDAVLGDGEQYIRGMNRAEVHGDVKDPAYQFYSRDQGLSYAYSQVENNKKHDWAPTGTDRYYRATVALPKKGSATLSFCRNQTKSFSKDVKTGKVDYADSDSAYDYLLYNMLLVKDAHSNGVWQVSHIEVMQRPQCKQ